MSESDTGVRTLEPPIPKPLFEYVINPFMKGILRSPLHGLLSNSLLLITFTGQKSGREYTTPVGYEQRNGTLYVTSQTNRVWWKNLRHGARVTVRLRGEIRQGHADVIEDDGAVAEYVLGFIDRHGLDSVNRLAIAIDAETVPEKETLATALTDTVVIRVALDDD